jgi:hypothetical protein
MSGGAKGQDLGVSPYGKEIRDEAQVRKIEK